MKTELTVDDKKEWQKYFCFDYRKEVKDKNKQS